MKVFDLPREPRLHRLFHRRLQSRITKKSSFGEVQVRMTTPRLWKRTRQLVQILMGSKPPRYSRLIEVSEKVYARSRGPGTSEAAGKEYKATLHASRENWEKASYSRLPCAGSDRWSRQSCVERCSKSKNVSATPRQSCFCLCASFNPFDQCVFRSSSCHCPQQSKFGINISFRWAYAASFSPAVQEYANYKWNNRWGFDFWIKGSFRILLCGASGMHTYGWRRLATYATSGLCAQFFLFSCFAAAQQKLVAECLKKE